MIQDKNLNLSEFNNKYKNDIEILIRLYINYKEIKGKENIKFQELNDNNKCSFYIINNNWIKKYKLFFEYELLEKYLNGILSNLNIQNNNSLSYEKISQIISSLPFEYIYIIMKKDKDEINKIIEQLLINNYKFTDKKEFQFLYNFQIINKIIYGKLNFYEQRY